MGVSTKVYLLITSQRKSGDMAVGVSVLLDFFGVKDPVFHRADLWENLLERIIEIGQLTKLHVSSYQFPRRISPGSDKEIRENESIISGGATAFALLAESHISVHTWPERGKVVVDVFTCGSESSLSAIVAQLGKHVPHTHMTVTRFLRGEE